MTNNFAIFTHVEHYCHNNKYFAYEPYVREMNLWIKYTKRVSIVAPLAAQNKSSNIAYDTSNVRLNNIPSIKFNTISSILRSIIYLPLIIWKIFLTMRKADHIHIRCPGNIGLIAVFIQLFFPDKSKTVKYAGNWDPKSKQPWTYNLQKKILSNTLLTKNIKVLVYGNWPGQSKNIIPFFTASFNKKEIQSIQKSIEEPIRFLFVGTFSKGKQPIEAIKICEMLNKNGLALNLRMFGEGDCFKEIIEYKKVSELSDFISVNSFIPLKELVVEFKKAHFLVLLSKSEGWPKVVAEAMFYGCIPIVSPVSCIPWMLGMGTRGIILDEPIKNNLDKITALVENKTKYEKISREAQTWSHKYTIDKFEAEIKKFL
ncbi:glycosyltransferase involved in cell wall biosynthesis [Christiangramia gaetbulicola]|uniref:Glycosyltransferase involved in cell wall biosynthesis n=1 Tax=Christiangramia gaetbulicola TaxID=703340 RepID=A0A2T6AJT5_9FLAO|nr:glycosyltransferase [Christiangramia gaetbulicola]PTX44057.1 glycosyltransferase involved in cell wall biosynthesis [Christiangramia gaetbulicola]